MSSVEDFSRLFLENDWDWRAISGADTFNEPINWDTGSATNMLLMFINLVAFNQPLAFDTSGVTDVSTTYICLVFPLQRETYSDLISHPI